jgi:hypothetical protein
MQNQFAKISSISIHPLYIEKEYKKIIPFIKASKNRNKLNKRGERYLQGNLQTVEKRNGRRLQKIERSPRLMDW